MDSGATVYCYVEGAARVSLERRVIMNRSIALKIKKTSHIESRHWKHAEKWTPSSPTWEHNKHWNTAHGCRGRQTNGSNITHAAFQPQCLLCLHSMECFRWISLAHHWLIYAAPFIHESQTIATQVQPNWTREWAIKIVHSFNRSFSSSDSEDRMWNHQSCVRTYHNHGKHEWSF